MKGYLLLLLSTVALSQRGALADEAGKSASEVSFTKPAALATESVDHRSALFGASDYGKVNQLYARVEVDKNERASGCPIGGKSIDGSKILVVDGYETCSFVTEALAAQARGAVGLIVVEDKCLSGNTDKHGDKWKAHCAERGTVDKISYMGGASDGVHIPAMIVSRWDGMRLIECAEMVKNSSFTKDMSLTGIDCSGQDEPIVNMHWNIPQKDTVNWVLWSSALLNADIFVKEFWYKDVIPVLMKKTKFTPRYFVWDGKDLGCTDGDDHCKDACHNGGRYCHFDPDGLGKGKIVGSYLSQENMRQACAYKQVEDKPEEQTKWWKYLYLVEQNCSGKNKESKFYNEDFYYSKACSEQQHKDAGLSFSDTITCINKAGGYDATDKENKMWDEELALRKNLDIKRLPTLVVNDRSVDFGASLKNVLVAICAGFDTDSQPEFCGCVSANDEALFSDKALVDRCILKKEPVNPPSGDGGSGGVSLGLLLFILLIVIGALGGTFYVLRERDRKRLRSEFHEDVRNIMGEYMRMDQDDADPSALGSFIGGGAERRDNYQHVVELS